MVIKTFLTTRLNVSCCPLMCEHLIIIQIDYDLRCFEPQHQRTFFIIKMLFIFQTLYMKWNKKKMLNGTHAFYEVIATLTTMNIPDNLELSNIAENVKRIISSWFTQTPTVQVNIPRFFQWKKMCNKCWYPWISLKLNAICTLTILQFMLCFMWYKIYICYYMH